MIDYIKEYKTMFELTTVNDETITNGMELLCDYFEEIQYSDKKVFFIGNGGSAAIANHMTIDYMKNGNFNTVVMYDSATITCLGNDYGYEYIFSKQLEKKVREGDVLVAISSSGNSKNIINAIKIAKTKGAHIITFTGFYKDNYVKQLGELNVYVPCIKYGIVESIHNMILQSIVDVLAEKRINDGE